MFADHARLTLVMRGHTDYNQYLDSIINTKPGETVDFSRIEMIIGIYGGPVQAAYDATLSAREKANSIKEAHKEAYRRGGPGENFLKPFMGPRLELGRAGETLKAEIASAARAV